MDEVERACEAMDLRRQGYSFKQIAKALGYADESGAFRAVERSLQQLRQENGEELLKMEIERLTSAMVGLQPRISNGDPNAVHALVALSARLAKLCGLDRPERTEAVQITIPGDPAQLRADLIKALEADHARKLQEAAGAADPCDHPPPDPA